MHRVRNEIRPSRENLAHGTHLCRNMFDTVKDPVVRITEDDVAVFSHDFQNQLLTAEISKLIQMLDLQDNDPLQ